ncbi:MAG: hypothetical protein A2W85_09740 [Bacteroidetes bacterium GWF2_41_31]|nr:MAG: hypothetical protein A2W85_09740 [Bacteroidetes bacterium GWF2_41_31]
MNFDFLIPYIDKLIYFILILLILYAITLVKSKAKNRALKSDIKEITDNKEQVISKYKKEIEEIRKTHELDIARRKYQYESKREAYYKFLMFLDNYNAKASSEMTEKFFPLVDEFMSSYLKASNKNSKKEENAILTRFFSKTNKVTKEAYEDYNKLKMETNTIKLSASKKVLEELESLENMTKEGLDEATKMMKRMPTLILSNDKDFNKEYQDYIEIYGKKAEIIKKYLIEFMRLDLNQI